jgi:hypothetical protein
MYTRAFLISCILVVASALTALGPDPFPPAKSSPKPGYVIPGAALPNGYARYKFGMSRETIVELIRTDPALRAWDADFIEGFEKEDWSVLSAVGPPHLDHTWFVFNDKSELWCVTLNFNSTRYSYLELAKVLKEKYGQPAILGQDVVIWQNDRVRLQLEKTLHLKYIDLVRFSTVSKEFSPELLNQEKTRPGIFDTL